MFLIKFTFRKFLFSFSAPDVENEKECKTSKKHDVQADWDGYDPNRDLCSNFDSVFFKPNFVSSEKNCIKLKYFFTLKIVLVYKSKINSSKFGKKMFTQDDQGWNLQQNRSNFHLQKGESLLSSVLAYRVSSQF